MIDAEELKGDVIEMILDTALNSEEVMPRTSSDFITLIKRIKNVLPQTMKALLDTIHLSARITIKLNNY
jgi:ATP-dependent helicase HrpA